MSLTSIRLGKQKRKLDWLGAGYMGGIENQKEDC